MEPLEFFFVAGYFLGRFSNFLNSCFFFIPPSLFSAQSIFIPPRCKSSPWLNRRPLHDIAPVHSPTRPAYSPHVLPLHLRAAETSAYTRLDHGSLPAATHRPTWSRSSTSPTMMCVYRIFPSHRPAAAHASHQKHQNTLAPIELHCVARSVRRGHTRTPRKMRSSDSCLPSHSRSTTSARSPPPTSSTTSSPTS